ncbi:MAG: hypothetical protein GY861_26590 [bacterium]|nr:hypothetical protein [bacterium]
MLANNITISVFCKEDENIDEISKKLVSLFPFDLEKEKLELKRENAKGFNEKKIVILSILIKKERHTKQFLEKLKESLNDDQKDLIKKQAETRLDEELNFFLRFDKEKLMQENLLWITDSGNCFHFRMSVATFPKKREKAIAVINEILS